MYNKYVDKQIIKIKNSFKGGKVLREFMISSLRTIMEIELNNNIGGDQSHLVIYLADGTKVLLHIRQLQ